MFRRSVIALARRGLRYSTDVTEPMEQKTRMVFTGERGINQVTLIGRAGTAAELRSSGKSPVSLFSLATSRTLRKPDGEYEQLTDWHRIVVFRPGLRDAVANNVKKGDKVYVSGAIRYSQYQPEGSTGQIKVASIVADDVMVVKQNTVNNFEQE